jgi:hypothetical protein
MYNLTLKPLISVAIATLASITLISSASANNFTQRSFNQQQRINAGIVNGSLSPREVRNLQLRRNALNAQIWRDTRDGGGLSRREQVNIERRFDNLSRSINREKRD